MKSLNTYIQIHKTTKRHATRFSVLVVVLLFGLFMEAYMHDFNLVYILLFFVFSLAFSAGPIGLLNLGHLKAHFSASGRFFAHQESMISLSVQNTSRSHSWSIYIYQDRLQVAFMPTVKAHNTHLIQLPHTPQKRGNFVYDTCYLQSKYPLSTVRFTREISDIYYGIAYPQPKGIPLFAYIQKHDANWGEEKEFDGLRTYDGSQRLSHIHWASVAKGEMTVKHFSKETQTQNLHFSFETLEGSPETRLSQLCLWTLECEKYHLPFSIAFPHKVLHSKKEGIDEILIWLARY